MSPSSWRGSKRASALGARNGPRTSRPCANSSPTTKNTNVVQAGKDVLVEQLSTITLDGDHHVSTVCHIFTVEDGRIQQLRTYRNDHGLPIG